MRELPGRRERVPRGPDDRERSELCKPDRERRLKSKNDRPFLAVDRGLEEGVDSRIFLGVGLDTVHRHEVFLPGVKQGREFPDSVRGHGPRLDDGFGERLSISTAGRVLTCEERKDVVSLLLSRGRQSTESPFVRAFGRDRDTVEGDGQAVVRELKVFSREIVHLA